MASGSASEVVHCPNCKEDVPKTLYCLNCGFPLYKEEQPKEVAKEVPEVKPEPEMPTEPAEEDAVVMVDEEEEAVEPKESKVEVVPEVTIEPLVEEVKSIPTIDPVLQPEEKNTEPEPEIIVEQITPEVTAPDPAQVVVVVEEKHEETVTPVTEPSVAPVNTAEVPRESLSTGIEASKTEATELVNDLEAPKTYIPDPLTKDLLENLARNISLRLKLVKLYREGVIKEATFVKIFEGYYSEGKIWSSRREEIIKKLSFDVEEMEDAYEVAEKALELLEVRSSIGEASEGEYTVKAPAYRWDIDNFDNMMGEKKNKINYLENISNALTDNEQRELRELASLQYNTLESLQVSNDSILATIKDSLYEAIKNLG